MGNGDLLVGPSHFMKAGLDGAAMARIWRYDIEPFLEDQFFGDQGTIDSYRWPKVLARHQARHAPAAEENDTAPAAAPATDTDEQSDPAT